MRRRRAIASLRRATGAWQELGMAGEPGDRTDRQSVEREPTHNPAPAIISRR